MTWSHVDYNGPLIIKRDFNNEIVLNVLLLFPPVCTQRLIFEPLKIYHHVKRSLEINL